MITSSSNQRVKQIIQWQTKARERRSGGIFLTEGFKLYEEVPAEWVQEVYVTEDALEKAGTDSALRDKLDKTGWEPVSPEVFGKMSDTRTPQGILCVVKRPEYCLEQMLSSSGPLLLVLENLQDPGNVGTILRTGEGAGVTGVILSEGTVDVYNPKTIRATMGSVFRVPHVYEKDLVKTVGTLRENGIRTYAAHLEGEKYYDSFSFRAGTAFLIGNEGMGLSRELAETADEYLKIPMEGSVESLNAAVTASILMYEAHRQRRRASHFQDSSS